LGKFFVKGADIASATTTDLSTATGQFINITGTTTITGFGTVAEGRWVIAKFTGALTLTYNATSLILPGLANITTAANDVAFLMSLGSGNWQCAFFQRASGVPIGGLPTSSTDHAIARFDGTTGKVQNSSATIDDTGNIAVSNASPIITITDTDTGAVTQLSASSGVGSFFIQVDTGNVGSAPVFRLDIGGTSSVISATEAGAVTIPGTLTVG
jgi:hypothetical protein